MKLGSWKKHSKAMNRSADGAAFGLDPVDGKFLLPKSGRLRDVVSGLIFLLTHRAVSPADCAHFFGVFQWMLLANRPKLAFFCGAIYRFIDSASIHTEVTHTAAVRDLALEECLLPGLAFDLRSEWTPSITTSDGAESFGYARGKCQMQSSDYSVVGLVGTDCTARLLLGHHFHH